jgi:hypothetical protein
MLACARTRLVRCDANDVLCPGEALTVTATTGKAWPRSWSAVLAWALGVLTLLGLGATVWLDWLLRQAGRPDLTQLDAYVIPWLPAAAIAATVSGRWWPAGGHATRWGGCWWAWGCQWRPTV